MTIDNAPVRLYVTYQGSAAARFDRDLYVNRHLPLVLSLWGKYGLQSARAFYPAGDADGTVAVCECLFRDDAAVEAAFSSPETPEVMADVALFTELTPTRFRAVLLESN